MTQFALAAQIRNILLCTLATLTLAACGSESGSSSAAATSADSDTTAASLVTPNVGLIDRSQGIAATGNTSASNAAVSTTTTQPTAPAGGTSGTVASNPKPTTPVKAATTGVA